MPDRVRDFPRLYGKSSTGKIKIWRIWVDRNKDGTAEIVTEHGYEEGEMQQARVKVTKGKNVGRSNETTPFEQAVSQAESKWNKKRDKKYAGSVEELESKGAMVLPMLAHDYKKRGHNIEWPAFVQPKLNGIRCLATRVDDDTITYTSRGGKSFTSLEHLTPFLLEIMEAGEVFDGELFTKALTFQQITAAVKRQKTVSEDAGKVEYWVYDCVMPGGFVVRNRHLKDTLPKRTPIVLVPTRKARDAIQMKKYHTGIVLAGYEGTIIRNTHGVYRQDHRSADLQKYKDFIDEEFQIVGGKEGVGKDAGAITFVCVTEEEKPFDCRPRGTYEQRQEWWKKRKKLVGKRLTVRYQTRSDDNIPIFPVGIAIRDYE